jgi:hypothetical protein
MDLKVLDNIINQFGTEFINKMKDQLTTNNSVATGTLKDSVNFAFEVDADRILIQFLSEDYGKYIESGRQAGTYPNVTKLQQWLQVKGIPIKASFPIAKNIYKYGIKPKPFLFNDFENKVQAFKIALMIAYGNSVQIELVDYMKKTLPKQFP